MGSHWSSRLKIITMARDFGEAARDAAERGHSRRAASLYEQAARLLHLLAAEEEQNQNATAREDNAPQRGGSAVHRLPGVTAEFSRDELSSFRERRDAKG
jgi:hypothetical protein